jgi:hypothetical protein
MHRSGSSAITRVLNLLGATLPEELIEAGDGNAVGHWESVAAVMLNDAILASAGSSWEDWGPINDDWRNSGVKGEMLDRVTQVVQDHVTLGPLFVLKDPRLCRLADLWLEAMAAVDVEPRVLLMLRNPAEVCASLEQRDLMAPGYGQLLWLRHVLDAEYFSRGVPRVTCHYDQLMRNWHGMVDRLKTGLGIALPRNAPAIHVEINKFLSGEHRHHELGSAAGLNEVGSSDWLRRTYAILLAWSEQGENPADHAELDQIRHEFDQAYSTFARLLLGAGMTGNAGAGSQLKRELSAQLEASRHAAEAASEAVEAATMRQAAAAEHEAELQARLAASHAQAAQLQTEIAALRSEAERAAQLASDADALRAREAELAAQLDAGTTQAAQLQTEIAALRSEAERAAQLASDADAMRAREAELAAQLDAGTTQAAQLQTEIAALRSEAERAAQLEMDAAALQARAAELSQDVSRLEAALRTVEDASEIERQTRVTAEQALAARIEELHQAEVRNAELAGRSAAVESALLQRQEELAQVWNTLLAAEKAAAAASSRAEMERERREDGERRLAAVDEIAVDLRSRLEEAIAAPAPVPDHLIAEIAQLTQLLHEQESLTGAAIDASTKAESDLAARVGGIAQITRSLLQQEAATRAAESACAKAESVAAARAEEIAQLTKILQQQEETAQSAKIAQAHAVQALEQQTAENRELQGRWQQQEAATRAAESARAQSEQKLAARFDEIARLTAMMADESNRAGTADANAQWLRSMMQLARRFPKWWALMPEKWRRGREHARYQRDGLFDAAKYLEIYPDVAENGMDPVRHYILHGMAEGRQRPQ